MFGDLTANLTGVPTKEIPTQDLGKTIDSGYVDKQIERSVVRSGRFVLVDDWHKHSNLELLDRLTESGDGNCYLGDDGYYHPVGDIGGDMRQSIYDTNGNGVVDDAEALGGIPAYNYALKSNLPQTTNDLPEGFKNLYYTEDRVAQNPTVQKNTHARHEHFNIQILNNITDQGDGTRFLADDGAYRAISGSGVTEWGDIVGDINNQTDLIDLMDEWIDIGSIRRRRNA